MVSEAPQRMGPVSVPGAGEPAHPPAGATHLAADEALPLRLALARGSLGIELNRTARLGPVTVQELAFSLPALRYPLDLSKGVKQFRSRRGRLQRLVLHVSLVELGGWLQTLWSEALGEPLLGVRIWPLPEGGLGVGLYSSGRSLAFDLLWCPQEIPRFLLERPRGVGLEVSVLAAALRALDQVTAAAHPDSPLERQGRVLLLRDVPGAVCRGVLPDYGCRVPAVEGMRAGSLEVKEGIVELSFDVDLDSPDATRIVLLGLESALQLRSADDLLARGEQEAARQAFVQVLTESVGSAAASVALADLDSVVPGRQEAALTTLEEVGGAESAGILGARVLAAVGHTERARETMLQAAEAEPFGPLAAQLFCRVAQLAQDPIQRVRCLDRAVARAPGLASVRWARFEDRVRRGDVEGALGDAQHMEAAAGSVSARHAVCLRAGRRFAESGHSVVARRSLERALRYAPEDPAARAALGRVFASLGMRSRAVALLQSALHGEHFSDSENDDTGELSLDLARLLGDGLDDLPQAIGRLRQVSARSAHAVAARALEAEYCERLGDLVGASRAYGRLREAAELGWARGPEVVATLRRGAELEERRGELAMAERHLYTAVSLSPGDEQLKAEYRRIAGRYAATASSSPERE